EHLDVDTREKLEEVLAAYEGTLLLTSHDRWLLRRVSNKVLSIQQGTLVQYPGGYGEYESRQPSTPRERADGTPSEEEQLLLETRLAYLGAVLGQIAKDDPAYAALEAEYLELARRLRQLS